jgi:hypothetical protein
MQGAVQEAVVMQAVVMQAVVVQAVVVRASGGGGERRGKHGIFFPSSIEIHFFRAISAGECLVVSIVALCGAKPNSLTPLGSVGLPLLKITM